MDGREAMAFSGGSASYYMHRGGVGVGGSSSGVFQAPPGFRALSNTGIIAQPNDRGQGGSTVDSSSIFSLETQSHHGNFNHGISIGASSGAPLSEPVKKKRGRPRKYGPGGSVSLKLSPMSAPVNSMSQGSTTPSEKRGRGRPRGSGRKQQLAALGIFVCLRMIICC